MNAQDVLAAIVDLWRKQAWWRRSVYGFGVCLAGLLLVPSPGTQRMSVQPADVASDQRLQALSTAFNGTAAEPRAGARCEKLTQAAQGLTSQDRSRVAKLASPIAVTAQPAVVALDSCTVQLAESDQHFARLADAVAKAGASGPPWAIVQAAQAFAALTGFDQSRDRFMTDSVTIARAKGYRDQVTESGKRIAALLEAARRVTNSPSSDNYRQFEAADRLTDLDRICATPEQTRGLEGLADLRKAISASKSRLARLSAAMAPAIAGTEAHMASLSQAVLDLTPLDELRAPELGPTIAKARELLQQKAWRMLADKMPSTAAGENPTADTEVARLYGVVKAAPAATTAQRDLAARAATHARAIAASDIRRQALLTAAQAWNDRSDMPATGVEEVLRTITPYDEKRFDDGDRRAMATLNRAVLIAHGVETGLKPENIASIPIAVTTAAGGEQNARFAQKLKTRLKGFTFVDDPHDAAITLDLDVRGLSGLPDGAADGVRLRRSAAQIAVRAAWRANSATPFIDTVIAPQGAARDENDAKVAALMKGISDIGSLLRNDGETER